MPPAPPPPSHQSHDQFYKLIILISYFGLMKFDLLIPTLIDITLGHNVDGHIAESRIWSLRQK